MTEGGEIDSETCGPYHVLLLVRAHGDDSVFLECSAMSLDNQFLTL